MIKVYDETLILKDWFLNHSIYIKESRKSNENSEVIKEEKMDKESLLKNLYEELQIQFDKKQTAKEITLDEKEICNETMEELIEEYTEQYKEIQKEFRELKKQEIKEIQREILAKYCKQFNIELTENKKKQSLVMKEKEIEKQLDETKTILDILTGKSRLGKSVAENIKDLGM